MAPTFEPPAPAPAGDRSVAEDLSPRGWTAGPAAFLGVATAVVALLFAEAWTRGLVLSQADHLYTAFPWVASEQAGWERPGNLLLGDVPQTFYPFLVFLRETLAAGHIPLWNPGIFTGHPFIGAYQSAVFSPFTWLALVFPLPYGLVPAAVARLVFGGLGMFLFVRRLGLAWPAALLAGFAFLLNPFIVVWLEHPHASAAVWLPWLLWSVERAAASGGPRSAALVAVLVGGELTAGHPETAFKLLLLVAAWAALAAWRSPHRLRVAASLAGGALLGVLLAAIQLLPFIEYAAESRSLAWRGRGLNPFVVPPQDLITALVPNFFGNPAHGAFLNAQTMSGEGTNYCEMTVYAGIATVILAAVAIAVRWRDGRVRLLGAAGIVSALLMYGVPGAHHLASALPLFRLSALSRFGFLVSVSLGVLAAFGFDHLVRDGRGRNRPLRVAETRSATIAAVGVVVVIWSWWFASQPVLRPNGMAPVARDWCLLASALAASCGTLAWLRSRGKIGWKAVTAGIVVLLIVDLFVFARGFHPLMSAERVFPALPEIEQVRREPGLFRVVGWDSALMPDAAMVYGLQDIRGVDGVWPARLGELLERDLGAERPYQRVTGPGAFRWLDFLNVRYVFATPGASLPADRFSRLSERGAPVYRNQRAFSRAFLVGHYEVATRDRALELVRDPSLDLSATVVLEDDLPVAERPDSSRESGGDAVVRRYENGLVEIETTAASRRLLVLTDLFYPGWMAAVDGGPVAVRRADYAFRAVSVPAGRHLVRLEYRPSSVAWGAAVSGLALACCLALGWLGRRARR